jgi:hypothetical protein
MTIHHPSCAADRRPVVVVVVVVVISTPQQHEPLADFGFPSIFYLVVGDRHHHTLSLSRSVHLSTAVASLSM